MFACNGILFNHESPRRGETFVTRKITIGVSKIFYGKQKTIFLGNLDSKRDWGHAKDYVEMQWLMLQQKHADDYVISTGKNYSIRQFVTLAFKYIGVKIKFYGKHPNEFAKIDSISKKNNNIKVGQVVIRQSNKYLRPNDVDTLLGSSNKAHKQLGWKSKISINELCNEMMSKDLDAVKNSSD